MSDWSSYVCSSDLLDRAYAAFAVAGTLCWRDVPTQLYWLAQAQAVGDVDVLAQRLDALLRLNIRHDVVANSLPVPGKTPLGQQALALLLPNDPPVAWPFVAALGELAGADLARRLTPTTLAAHHAPTLHC